MTISISTVSTKGQVVLPVEIRKYLGIEPHDRLLLFAEEDTLIIKKIDKKSFRELLLPVWEKTKKLGLTEDDINALISEARQS